MDRITNRIEWYESLVVISTVGHAGECVFRRLVLTSFVPTMSTYRLRSIWRELCYCVVLKMKRDASSGDDTAENYL